MHDLVMPEKKQSLSGVLNVRVDDALSREIDRIAKVEESSASEAARKLIGYGVSVQRQVEASYLALPYELVREATEGRVVITAEWKPWTQRELWEMEDEARAAIYEAEEYGNR
jgi:predicted transcriptional regulator